MRFGDKLISFPIFAKDTIEHLLATDDVRVVDLRGPLDVPSKVVVVKRLVREGAVEVRQLDSASPP